MPTVLVMIAAVAVVLVLVIAVSYNSFVKLRNHSDEAFSTMDVYLKKRYDLIPNLVETVKQYAFHERETLEKIVQARSIAMGARSFEERTQGENMISSTLRSLFAVSENYPQLRANENFMMLQNQLVSLEDEISQSRKYYNGVVKVMNNKVEMFPSNLIAAIMGFKRYPYFMADVGERQNIQVRF